MGKLASRDELGLAQYFDTIYAGIRRAFADKIIRLTNPIALLEHGLQADNLYISTLLCVMGLDMLLMAGKITPFVERACGFLGPSTYVFPLDSCYNCQPSPTVADVIADVYKLRNVIAHGQRVPPRYLQPYTLRCTNGVQVNDTPYPYRYGELMQEAARFLLTASLRKIFTAENLLDHVNDDKKWGFQMSLFERRQRATAPAPVAKRRGR